MGFLKKDNKAMKRPEGKITEKELFLRIGMSFMTIVVCLASMGISAFAYYTCTISSANNTIKAAYFDIDVRFMLDGQEVTLTQNENGQYTGLEAGKEYNIVIKNTGTADNGFCLIKLGQDRSAAYHTQQFDKNHDTLNFTLTLDTADVVSIYSHWGTSSYYAQYAEEGINSEYYILNGEYVFEGAAENPEDANNPEGNTSEEGSSSTEIDTESGEGGAESGIDGETEGGAEGTTESGADSEAESGASSTTGGGADSTVEDGADSTTESGADSETESGADSTTEGEAGNTAESGAGSTTEGETGSIAENGATQE